MFGFYIDKQNGITTCVCLHFHRLLFYVMYVPLFCYAQSYMLVPVLRAPPEPLFSPSFDLVQVLFTFTALPLLRPLPH